MTGNFRMEAHRGVCTSYPENTIPAFLAAVWEGYDMIELDLKCTKDNVIVVLHDKTIARTARTSTGEVPENCCISELTYTEAAIYDYGLHNGEAFRDTCLPLFTDILAFAKKESNPPQD